MGAKPDLAAVVSTIYKLLDALQPDERQRAVSSVLTLLGISSTGSQQTAATPLVLPGGGQCGIVGAQAFFAQKEPGNKLEELAVAARYREQQHNSHEHSKADLQKVFKDARRNFDVRNFARDINNAKTKGLFNRGKENQLAYYGQQYVDALPNRDAVKALKRPKKSRGKPKSGK